ncbi:MAG TPA: vanadium-dependent haloperoxidase [Candidatus Limnocylindrales bacterium]|nr:vanadium-dependent haloperoxidase [Candidatus Limnocylindrales bacterium]
MTRPGQPASRRRHLPLALAAVVTATAILPATVTATDDPATAVLDWNANAVAALSNSSTASPVGAGQPPQVASVHVAMVQLAVYDAVNSIAATGVPYLDGLPSAPPSASKPAAVATAAHHVLVGLTPALPQAVLGWLDGAYGSSLAAIPDGAAKAAGVAAGAAAAAAMLDARADDGRYGSFRFSTGTDPGEWRPVLPANVNDPNGWLAEVEPFSITSPGAYLTEGHLDMTSEAYAVEFDEVKTLGARNGSSRSLAQTTLARFVTANPVVMLSGGLRDVADARDLSITEAARLLGMTSMSGSDALIACWAAKEHWSFWRPITAIRLADTDGNPATVAQPDWEPFFDTPPYPEHPSGYNCYTGGVMHAARAFFGTDHVAISLTNPAVGTREYDRLTRVVDDTIDGRIYTGFHFRTGDVQGAWIGKKVAQWVDRHELLPAD